MNTDIERQQIKWHGFDRQLFLKKNKCAVLTIRNINYLKLFDYYTLNLLG